MAAAIGAASPEQLDELAGLLAHHWQEAGEPLRAAGWHVRAARWVRASDMAASRRHWEHARALLLPLPESAERARLLLEVYPELINMLVRLGADAAESEAVYREGIEIARQTGSRRAEALIDAAYGWLLSTHRDFPRMIELGQRAVAMAEQEGDVAVETMARFVAGRGCIWSGHPAQSLAIFDPVASKVDEAQGWAMEVLGWPVYADALSLRAVMQAWRGQPREALAFIERLSAELRRPGQSMDLSSAACDRIWTWLILGDAARMRRDTAEALAFAERFGSPRITVYALLACGMASAHASHWREARDYLERSERLLEESGAGAEWRFFIEAWDALCLAKLGERAAAVELATRCSARAAGVDVSHLYVLARALREVGGLAYEGAIDSALARNLKEVERCEYQGILPIVLLERASLARLRGDSPATARDLAEARRLFAESGVTGWDDYARSIEA